MRSLWYVLSALCGYCIGCFNPAALLARAKGFDIRKRGSGNAGASNALLTMGKKAAVLTAVSDMAKAFVPVFLLLHLPISENLPKLPLLCGSCVILGHLFPFWMQFRGGKGFTTLLGLSLALDWRFFVAEILLTAVILLTVRYIALATLLCTFLLPILVYLKTKSFADILILAPPILCMLGKHIENLHRIAKKTEIPFGKKHL